MTVAEQCPRCGGTLAGLARYCHTCGSYVTDIGSDAGPPATDAYAWATRGLPDERLEDAIQLAARKALLLLGFKVYDLSQDRPTRQTPGVADLYVCGYGRCTWGEMKKADGVQSAEQVAFESVVTKNGAEYHVWRHENEAIEWAKAVLEGA